MDINKPIENQACKAAITAYQKEPTQEHMNAMINEVMRAHFLNPAVMNKLEGKQVDGSLVLEKDTTIQFPLLQTPDSASFAMAFCDWGELKKWHDEENQQVVAFTFDEYATMILPEDAKIDGFVIDPYGANLVFSKELIASLKQQKEAHEQERHTMALQAGTKVQLGEPKDYPVHMCEALKKQAKSMKEVKAIYLQLMMQNEEQSYLLVVDHDGEEQEIYQALAAVALPYRKDKFVDFTNLQSELGRSAIRSCEPFYHKLFYKKPQFQEPFKAVVEEIFSLKGGEVLLVCDVVSGAIEKGSEVTYHDSVIKGQLSCRILEIEQPSGKVTAASCIAKGTYGTHFAFMIPDHTSDEFHKGGILTQ